jgi:DNA-binding NtrC family response regulator
MGLRVLIVEDQFLEGKSLSYMVSNAGHSVERIAKSVGHAMALLQKQRPDIVLIDIYLKGDLNGIDLARKLDQLSVPFIFISANSNASILQQAIATRPYGFLVKPFSEREIVVALNIAMYRHQDHREFLTRQHTWLRSLLKHITYTHSSRPDKALSIITALTSFLPFDFVMIDTDLYNDSPSAVFRFQRTGFDQYIQYDGHNPEPDCGVSADEFWEQRKRERDNRIAYFVNAEELQQVPADDPANDKIIKNKRFRAKLWLPLSKTGEIAMSIVFYCCNEGRYTTDHLNLMLSVQDMLTDVVDAVQAPGPIPDVSEKHYVQAPNQLLKPGMEGIIGRSPQLLQVLDKVSQVAPYDSTVLILGETGVGKEGIAKAIHRLSSRRSKPLVKINCAAIPANLMESELFGHEKGAFTGAVERRIGKFEQAHGGTLFLDEIAELPMETQAKLLRAIQEKEIERIGGRSPIRVDVRIISATNRNLLNEIAGGRFRLDLYYRINVYPIRLASLRERREDISALATHYLQMYGSVTRRGLMTIAPAAMRQLEEYGWPGNIRELQHLIERHVLDCKTATIQWFDMPEAIPVQNMSAASGGEASTTMISKDQIMSALRRCNGKISGKGGAAELLQLPPSTLTSKIKRYGIQWPPAYL